MLGVVKSGRQQHSPDVTERDQQVFSRALTNVVTAIDIKRTAKIWSNRRLQQRCTIRFQRRRTDRVEPKASVSDVNHHHLETDRRSDNRTVRARRRPANRPADRASVKLEHVSNEGLDFPVQRRRARRHEGLHDECSVD